MVSFLQLRAQHASLRATMRHLLDVATPARGYRAAAPGLLRDLDGALAAHVAGEATLDYSGLALDAEPLALLAGDWRTFTDQWSTTRIAADWAGFAAATHAIVPRMIARIAQEDAWLAGETDASL